MAVIWAEVLGRARVGALDDFFGLGGDPAAATAVVDRLGAALGFPIPAGALLDRPVLREFAAELDHIAMTALDAVPTGGTA